MCWLLVLGLNECLVECANGFPNILEIIHCAIDEKYLIIVFPNGETAPNDVGLSMVAFFPNSNTDGRLHFAHSYFPILNL